MIKVWLKALAVSGFIAVLLHSTAPMTEAGMDEAVQYYQIAKGDMPNVLDAAAQEKPRLFGERVEQFKKNMDIVQAEIERAGKNLHEKERKWIAETTKEKASAKYMKVVAAIASVKQALSEAKSPSSETSNLKSEWGEFCDAFEKLWEDYQQRGKQLAEYSKEMEERVKLFREDCKKCL